MTRAPLFSARGPGAQWPKPAGAPAIPHPVAGPSPVPPAGPRGWSEFPALFVDLAGILDRKYNR